jgi:hypothetical protein
VIVDLTRRGPAVFCEFIHKPAILQTRPSTDWWGDQSGCTPRAAVLTGSGVTGYVPGVSSNCIRHHHVHHHSLTGWGDMHVHG